MHYDERFRREMMETDIAVGSSIRAVVGRETLSSRLSLVSRAASPAAPSRFSAGCSAASNGLLELEATDMELSLRTSVPAAIEGEGRSSSRRSCSATSSPVAGRRGDARVPAGGRRASIESGSYSGRLNVFAAEDFPRLPSWTCRCTRSRPLAARHGAAVLARRPATSPARCSPASSSSRARLTGDGGEGDGAPPGRSSRRSSPPGRSRSSRSRRRRGRARAARSQREPRRLRRR